MTTDNGRRYYDLKARDGAKIGTLERERHGAAWYIYMPGFPPGTTYRREFATRNDAMAAINRMMGGGVTKWRAEPPTATKGH